MSKAIDQAETRFLFAATLARFTLELLDYRLRQASESVLSFARELDRMPADVREAIARDE